MFRSDSVFFATLAVLAPVSGWVMWRWAPEGLRGQYAFLGVVLGPLAFLLLLGNRALRHTTARR